MKQSQIKRLIFKKNIQYIVFDIEHVLISNLTDELKFLKYKTKIEINNVRQKFFCLYQEALLANKQIFFVNNTSFKKNEIMEYLKKNNILGNILNLEHEILQQINQQANKNVTPKEILYIYHNTKNALTNKKILKVRVKSEFQEFFGYMSSHRVFWFQQNIFPQDSNRYLDIAFNMMLANQIQYFMQTVKKPKFKYLLNKNLNFAGAYMYSPLIIKMAQTILREAKQSNIKHIYLLARDGYLIEKVLKIFAPFYELQNLEIKYIHFNRHHFHILKNKKANTPLVKEYLKQEINTNDKIAFYDIGYSGNQIRRIAKALNIKPKFFMIFQTLENYYKNLQNNEDSSILFTLENSTHSQATLLETIHSDPYYMSSKDYLKKDGKILPQMEKNSNVNYDLIQIQEGIIDFAKFYASKMGADLQYLEPSTIYIRAIEQQVFASEEFSLFKNITFDDPFLFDKQKNFLQMQKRIHDYQKQTEKKNLIIAKYCWIYKIYKIIVKHNTQHLVHAIRNFLRRIKGKK